MTKNTNISIIQLIQSSEISVNYEISKIKAGKSISVKIKTYLEGSDHYQSIQQHIETAKNKIASATNEEDKLHFGKQLEDLYKVESSFIINTLNLAQTLSKIEPRTDRLKMALRLFEKGKIKEADKALSEADLLNDQFELIAFVEYQRNKIKALEYDYNNEPHKD